MTVNPGIETTLEVWELTLPGDEAKCASTYGCTRPAEWLVVRHPCKCDPTPLCTECKATTQKIWAAISSWACEPCGSHITHISWHAI